MPRLSRRFLVFPFKFKHSGKSPGWLFNNLEMLEIKGVFSGEKTPFGGSFLGRRFSSV
jgi:hypothetical protein